MMRQDAWTEEEDMLLAETVLAFVREGGTQLRAFEEVGKNYRERQRLADFVGTHTCASDMKRN
ncbi:Prespore-specific transcriptional regulator RsfA [Anoxybacillus sp. BCO1]|nr:Prespore-specific transcriptional regulator RsfA [Anoxybacillus sp. BCO1]